MAAGIEDCTVAVHTVVDKVAAADMAVVDRVAVHMAANMVVSEDMAPIVHKLFVEPVCLLSWGCRIPHRILPQDYFAAHS
jgi:hypothetical protein